MNVQAPIHIVGVGYHRIFLEEALAQAFANIPYKLSAILDLEESLQELQYLADNLAVIPNSLYPRPQILITGTAIRMICYQG